MMIKHATASVFVFNRDRSGVWRTGLVEHPVFGHWIMPGGHVEIDENPEEAALREVAEETGLAEVRLLDPHGAALPDDHPLAKSQIAAPWVIVEHYLEGGDRHIGDAHVHIDHEYLAVADNPDPVTPPAHPFDWYRREQLAGLSMFNDTRASTHLLFELVAEC